MPTPFFILTSTPLNPSPRQYLILRPVIPPPAAICAFIVVQGARAHHPSARIWRASVKDTDGTGHTFTWTLIMYTRPPSTRRWDALGSLSKIYTIQVPFMEARFCCCLETEVLYCEYSVIAVRVIKDPPKCLDVYLL